MKKCRQTGITEIASILHLKVQEMPAIMKIDRKFNMKEIVNLFMDMFMDVTRIYYRHKKSFILTRKSWQYIIS